MNTSQAILVPFSSSSQTAHVYLGIGAILGDRENNLREGLHLLERDANIRVERVSGLYRSPHMGLAPGDKTRFPFHLNAVAEISTTLKPIELLDRLLEAEEESGRVRSEKWGARTLDLDIVLWESLTLSSERLMIPHPGLSRRAFVVVPLLELNPRIAVPNGTRVSDFLGSLEADLRHLTRIRDVEWYTGQKIEAKLSAAE